MRVIAVAGALLLSMMAGAQELKPTVINVMQASKQRRTAPEVVPDYSTKKEKKVVVVEARPGDRILPPVFAAPQGPQPGRVVEKKTGHTATPLQRFAGTLDEPTLNLQSNTSTRNIPPDVGGYVGPDHVVSASNNQLRMFSKTGTELLKIDHQLFWQGTTGYAETGAPYGAGDPHIIYDRMRQRWIIVAQTSLNATSSLLLGVSQTADPTGNWNRYLFRTDATGTTGIDFPQVGYNEDWIVVTGNMFNITTSTAAQNHTYVFNKSDLYAGAAVVFDANAKLLSSTISSTGGWGAPVTPLDASPVKGTMYMLQPFFSTGGNGACKLTTITGTLPNVTWNSGSGVLITSPMGNYTTSSFGSILPQKEESRLITANDGRFAQAIMINGRIWATHHVRPTTGVNRVAIQWWQLNTDGSVVQNGKIDDPTGRQLRVFPSLSVNAAEDMVIGYSLFSKVIHPSAAYSARRACTPANTMAYEVLYKAGESTYFKDFGGSRARWGDYSYTIHDPASGHFWTVQEYAAQRVGTADNSSRWGTYWAEVEPEGGATANFQRAISVAAESDATSTIHCRNYTDISIPINIACTNASAGLLQVSRVGGTASATDAELLTTEVAVPGNAATVNVMVRVFNDAEVEPDETFVLAIASASGSVAKGTENSTHTLYIQDNDNAPLPSGAGTITAGSAGNTTSSGQPFRGDFRSSKTQMIYTAAELRAKGLATGNITAIGFTVASKRSTAPYKNVSIRMQHTTLNAFPSPVAMQPSTFLEVYSSPSYSTVAGVNTFNLQTPFLWNGIDNIMVEFCFANTAPEATPGNSDVSNCTGQGVARAVWVRENTETVDCSTVGGTVFSSFTDIGDLRPDARFTGVLEGTAIATALGSAQVYLGPQADAYVYNATGELMARIQNLTGHDYGCTEVRIDRAGAVALPFWNNTPANFVTSKTIALTPTNPLPNGQYNITLYYTPAEVAGYQTTTARNWNSVFVNKTLKPVSTYTPGLVPPSETQVVVSPQRGTLGSNQTLTASFTGMSGFAAGIPDDALPVTGLDLKATLQQGMAVLNWSTLTEQNVLRFEVEMSTDGRSFSGVGQVAARGNSSVLSHYSMVHPATQQGRIFYRVKMVDASGDFTYSKVVVLVVAGPGVSRVYPSPANSVVQVAVSAQHSNTVNYQLMGADMRSLMQGRFTSNSNQWLPVSNLKPGVYFIRLQSESKTELLRFVKQ